MTNSLNYYIKFQNTHILTSEMFCSRSSDIVSINKTKIQIKSTTFFQDFICIFLLTNIKANRKRYHLSAAEKKFQTTILTHSFLQLNLNKKLFFWIFKYAFKNVFRDYLAHPKKKAIRIFSNNLVLQINNFPFLFYNKNYLFKTIFFNKLEFDLSFSMKLNARAFTKIFFFSEFSKLIMKTHLKWT